MSRARRCAGLVAAVLLLAGLPAGPARAETAAEAREAARSAAARVEALQPQVRRALRAYERSLGRLAAGVTRSISAQQDADEAAERADDARAEEVARVRALYMTGSPTALYASVLGATSAGDAMRRVAYVQALVRTGSAAATAEDASSRDLRDRASRLGDRVEDRVVTASQVQQRYEDVAEALSRATAEYESLSRRARRLEEAQSLLARIARLNAVVDAAGAQRVATARATGVPTLMKGLYVAAAKTCRGLSWTVLSAIGQVETNHGANTSTSYAGAQGPMQFMPATFAAYGVDGDKDGDKEIDNPTDAVFSAARYLCANGAGRGDEALARAVWHYNHADWYVQLVLKLAAQYADTSAGASAEDALGGS